MWALSNADLNHMLLLVSVYSAVVHPVAIYNIRAGSGEIMGSSLPGDIHGYIFESVGTE